MVVHKKLFFFLTEDHPPGTVAGQGKTKKISSSEKLLIRNLSFRRTKPFPLHPVQHPPRIHPGPGQSRRETEPADPDTAVIPGEEDLRAAAGNDEVNQDQGSGADDKGAGTCDDLKIPP